MLISARKVLKTTRCRHALLGRVLFYGVEIRGSGVRVTAGALLRAVNR
jgi:hypothetical protein